MTVSVAVTVTVAALQPVAVPSAPVTVTVGVLTRVKVLVEVPSTMEVTSLSLPEGAVSDADYQMVRKTTQQLREVWETNSSDGVHVGSSAVDSGGHNAGGGTSAHGVGDSQVRDASGLGRTSSRSEDGS